MQTTATDPLAELRRRIDRAREVRSPGSLSADSDESEDSDPLEALRRRVESASEWRGRGPEAALNPLEELIATLERARRRFARGELEPSEPDRPPSSATGDPLQRLRRLVGGEIGAIGSRGGVELPRSVVGRTPETGTADDLEARVGREVLALLRERPLPGSARAEAVERLVAALDDPDAEALREILEILIAPHD